MTRHPFLEVLKQKAPILVASLDGDNDLEALMQEAKGLCADAVEIRLDLWSRYLRDEMSEKIAGLRQKFGLPMVISFRGGAPFPTWWQEAYWRSLDHASLIDFEWNPTYPWRDIGKNLESAGVPLVISHHDHHRTPPLSKLAQVARAAYNKGAEVVKIATRVECEADVRALLNLNSQFAGKRLITVMGMGPFGPLSRLVAPLFDACLVYGYIGRATANGQLPYKEMKEQMRRLYPRYEAHFKEWHAAGPETA